MADIKDIHEGTTVLGEFGIKVVGQVESSSDLPDPTEYDGEYGDAYVVGEEAPYDYYIFTRPFEDVDDPQWFNLGQFPAPGPQGETGETGATGATPAIVATATTSTLSAGQDASVTITKTGTDEEPHFTFAFEIPQGVQGVQGVQGAQGIQGPAGPQGIQGQKGDTGYLYTIIGQVNDESSLPLPGQVGRTSAFLVGTQEPYDVYIIIGQDAYDLEWLNIGPIATVVPTTYIASATDASSGTLDATTLAAITNETGVHYMRVGSELYEYANTYNGNAYYMSLRYDSSISRNKIARFIVALSSGAWTTGSDAIPDADHTVFTNTDQTITGTKTFSSTINVGPAFRIGVNGTSPSEYYSLLRTGAYSEGIFFHTDGIAVGAKLYPGSNNTYDLGSSTNKWKDLWLSGYLRDGTNSILLSDIDTLSGTQTISGTKTFSNVIKASKADVSLVGLNGIAGFRAYKPGTTTSAGQMIVTNDGTVPGSYRAVIQAYNGTQDAYNTLRIGDTEGFKYYVNNDNVFTIGNDGSIFGNQSSSGTGLILQNNSYGDFKVTLPKDSSYMELYDSTGDYTMHIGNFGYGAMGITSAGLYIDADMDGDGEGYLYLSNMPSSDPEEGEAIWDNGGVLMRSGATEMPVFNPGIQVGTFGSNDDGHIIMAAIPFYDPDDPVLPTSSTVTRSGAYIDVSGIFEIDTPVTIEQQGIVIGSSYNFPFIDLATGMNYIKLPDKVIITANDSEDDAYEMLVSEGSVTVKLRDGGLYYLGNDGTNTTWIVPSLAVKLKRNNAYFYINQTPSDVDGPEATYDLTNISIPSGYTLPDSGSRGIAIGLGGYAQGQINWITAIKGLISLQDY